MTEHGYDGARSFMFLTEQLDLWNSTSSQMVSSADWDEVKSVYLDDRFELGLDEFFDQHNPWAQQMLMVNLLGAADRGHWQASDQDLADIASQLVQSTLAHGPACEPGQCRNSALTAQIETVLADLPDMAPAMAAYNSAISQAQQAAPTASSSGGAAQQVTGRVMETQSAPGTAEARLQPELFWLVIAFLALVLLLAGWFSAGRAD
jgi:cobaltochelatase CobN